MSAASLDFIDLRVRAELLELCDDPEGAERLRARSLEIAREVDLTCYAYQLMWRNRAWEAIALLEVSAARHPNSWNVWDSLGEAYAQAGEIRRAIECYGHASRLIDDEPMRLRIEHTLRDLLALGAIAS
jgi:predicted Zn-dependent protease